MEFTIKSSILEEREIVLPVAAKSVLVTVDDEGGQYPDILYFSILDKDGSEIECANHGEPLFDSGDLLDYLYDEVYRQIELDKDDFEIYLESH